MKKTKKKNPQDATLRNIRALKVRVKKLEDKTIALEAYVKYLHWFTAHWFTANQSKMSTANAKPK